MDIILNKDFHELSSSHSEGKTSNMGLVWLLGCMLITVSQTCFGNIMSILAFNVSTLSAQPTEMQSSNRTFEHDADLDSCNVKKAPCLLKN